MKYPREYTLKQITRLASENFPDRTLKDGDWVPARPLGYPSLRSRFKLAWKVFTGKSDVLTWPGDEEWM